MQAIQLISNDLFDKIRSRFQNLEMGDETGAVTIDPSEARFFDFDFVREGVDLGRVSISLNDLGSVKIYYSQGITENQDDMSKKMWYAFLKEMRLFAMRRLLRFDTRDIAKNNLDRNDFQFLAAKGSKEEPMNMNESRWNHRSTKKTSRAVKGKTEVIVRHTEAMDEMFPGARSMPKKIKAIFIQNKDGERFKYPFIHPAGAFAMAQHVDHGGAPHDPAGKAIVYMSEQIAQLQEFQRKLGRSTMNPDAMGISERANAKLQELKRHIDMLGKRHHYLSWRESFDQQPMDDGPITELDPVQMEEYKAKFTETNFKEDLIQFFPLIHRIMGEMNDVDLDSYVQESHGSEGIPFNGKVVDTHSLEIDGVDRRDHPDYADAYFSYAAYLDGTPLSDEELDALTDKHGDIVNQMANDSMYESPNEFQQFETWAEAVEQGKLTDDEINELKQAIEQLPKDPNGLPQLQLTTAQQFFNEFGIDDPDLDKKLDAMGEVDPTTNAFEVFQVWAKESYPELLVSLGMSGTEEPAAAEPAQPPAEPAAPAPEEVPAAENTDMQMPPGTNKGKDPKAIIAEVARIVKSMYNRDNPNVGPFRGEEGIAIDVEKQVSEKFGDQAGEQARHLAEKFMAKLTQEWQERHGKAGPVDDTDGLARLKELVSNIKAKVEGIGDQGQGGRDFNKNIMSDEKNPQHSHQYDVTMKHADNPTVQQRMAAHDIKPGIKGYRDRVDLLKDLERTGKLKSEEMTDAEKADHKSKVPAFLRKEKGGDWKTSTQDLEKAKEKNISGSQGLAALKAQTGVSEEFTDIMKLAGLAK